jgi:hypothetical protein
VRSHFYHSCHSVRADRAEQLLKLYDNSTKKLSLCNATHPEKPVEALGCYQPMYGCWRVWTWMVVSMLSSDSSRAKRMPSLSALFEGKRGGCLLQRSSRGPDFPDTLLQLPWHHPPWPVQIICGHDQTFCIQVKDLLSQTHRG